MLTDTTFFDCYHQELRYLREHAVDFAHAHPGTAQRLGVLSGDPDVERILEGVAYLSARVQTKLQAEFPAFTQRLLEQVCPHLATPVPAIGIVELLAQPTAEGHLCIPRHTRLIAPAVSGYSGQEVRCEFRTAHSVHLWPLSVVDVRYGKQAYANLHYGTRASLTVSLQTQDRYQLSELARMELDRIAFYVDADDVMAAETMEAVLAHTLRVSILCEDGTLLHNATLTIRPIGWSREESALMHYDARSPEGDRLLREWFAAPARYRFFEVSGLKAAMAQLQGRTFTLIWALDNFQPLLETLRKQHLRLHCTPIVNLFETRFDRSHLRPYHETEIIADRHRPMDFEILQATDIEAYGQQSCLGKLRPLYHRHRESPSANTHIGYFSTRRSISTTHTGYPVSQTFLTVHADDAELITQIGGKAWVTNGDLPQQLATRAQRFSVLDHLGVTEAICHTPPSRAWPALCGGAGAWDLVSQLNTYYHGLEPTADSIGLAATLRLHGRNPAHHAYVDAIDSVNVQPAVERFVQQGRLAWVHGHVFEVHIRRNLIGVSPYLFGYMLNQFLLRHAAINTFLSLRLIVQEDGAVFTYPANIGKRPTC